jgi:IS5 family transposase
MVGELPNDGQQVVWGNDLRLMCNPNHDLVRLANRLEWAQLELRFIPLYSPIGRPSIPLRVMIGLLILAEMRKFSDEEAVKEFCQNFYWQYFCGYETLTWEAPCHPTELGKFRQRIGPDGVEAILTWTVAHHQEKGNVQTKLVVIDSTVQEKNVTTPRDHKLYRKIAETILGLAAAEGVVLRRSYRRVIRRQVMQLRTGNFPKGRKRAARATRRLRTIAGALLRDFSRKVSPDRRWVHEDLIARMQWVLVQPAGGPEHIYSLHEPQTYCIGKGKDRVQYEFGTKVTLAIDPHSGVIVGAMNHAKHRHDSHVMAEVSEQIESITGAKPHEMIGDHGYRDAAEQARLLADGVRVITPTDLKRATKGTAEHRSLRRKLKLRSRIEAVIGHLKSDHRLGRNFLRGWLGDEQNVLLAAVGWNIKKLIRFFSDLLHGKTWATWARMIMPLNTATA